MLVLALDLTLRTPRVTPGSAFTRSWNEKYYLSIPVETLIAWCHYQAGPQFIPASTGEDMRVSVSTTGDVPWESWGPHGTCMVVGVGGGYSLIGAKAAFPYWKEHAGQVEVTVYEVHPLVSFEAANGHQSDVVEDPHCWKDPVRTTYPFRKTVTTFDTEGRSRWSSRVLLTCDGLVLTGADLEHTDNPSMTALHVCTLPLPSVPWRILQLE